MEGRHCTVVRSKVADNSVTVAIRYTASTRSNTGEVYCRGTDTDTIKLVASTPAYSVKGYDYSTVARAKPNANEGYSGDARTNTQSTCGWRTPRLPW